MQMMYICKSFILCHIWFSLLSNRGLRYLCVCVCVWKRMSFFGHVCKLSDIVTCMYWWRLISPFTLKNLFLPYFASGKLLQEEINYAAKCEAVQLLRRALDVRTTKLGNHFFWGFFHFNWWSNDGILRTHFFEFFWFFSKRKTFQWKYR